MKLLFPIFASLVLQSQVNTEFLGLKKCLKGFGKCKNHCTLGEKEIEKCKTKKCCIGPKMVRIIKNFIQLEMLHSFEEDSQGFFKNYNNSNAVIPKKYILSILPKIISISPSTNTNTIIITNTTTLNSNTTSTATSTKTDTTGSIDSAITSTLPAPPPPP
ncbi:beta-defensin 129 [Trichechus manatus latirostris]|uniref:Beta-defensin 129 n=1 Tax=Trichechus manatus latirostris TaxID=127582 RepID=A0A2Y9DAV6_TRIMA|nr:beta-defensin 129 [Trichechus manatus latirostris]